MTSPLEQAQEINEDYNCTIDMETMQECKAKAQTLLETCEWILFEEGKDERMVKVGLDYSIKKEINQAISICKEILGDKE